jgi:hypothetical protein
MQSFDDYCTKWKSAPFRIRTKFESLSEPLQLGIRFFHSPIPASPSVPLASYLPLMSELIEAKNRAYHVP